MTKPLTFLKSRASEPVRLGLAGSAGVAAAVLAGATLPGFGLLPVAPPLPAVVVTPEPPTILTGMRTCVPSSVCACWNVMICWEDAAPDASPPPPPPPMGDAMLVADPGTGPHVKRRRLALPALMLPAAGELKRSAAVGDSSDSVWKDQEVVVI